MILPYLLKFGLKHRGISKNLCQKAFSSLGF